MSISHVSTREMLLCAHTSNRKVTETIFVIKYLLFETLKRCSDYFTTYYLITCVLLPFYYLHLGAHVLVCHLVCTI